jgi:hypothetical protein
MFILNNLLLNLFWYVLQLFLFLSVLLALFYSRRINVFFWKFMILLMKIIVLRLGRNKHIMKEYFLFTLNRTYVRSNI